VSEVERGEQYSTRTTHDSRRTTHDARRTTHDARRMTQQPAYAQLADAPATSFSASASCRSWDTVLTDSRGIEPSLDSPSTPARDDADPKQATTLASI
jgi:hypothetical protein